MKTPSLQVPIDEFRDGQDEVIRHWTAEFSQSVDISPDFSALQPHLELAFAGITAQSKIPTSGGHLSRLDMQHACTTALMSTARNWEKFRSEWHIRAVAKDATILRQSLQQRVDGQLAQTALGKSLDKAGVHVPLQLAKHPGLEAVRALLDAEDANITFSQKNDSEDRADKELSGPLATKAKSLTLDDWKLITLVRTTRNAIAHGSVKSLVDMNKAIQAIKHTRDPGLRALGRQTNSVSGPGIGVYLYAYHKHVAHPYAAVRVIDICLRMKDLADRFV